MILLCLPLNFRASIKKEVMYYAFNMNALEGNFSISFKREGRYLHTSGSRTKIYVRSYDEKNADVQICSFTKLAIFRFNPLGDNGFVVEIWQPVRPWASFPGPSEQEGSGEGDRFPRFCQIS